MLSPSCATNQRRLRCVQRFLLARFGWPRTGKRARKVADAIDYIGRRVLTDEKHLLHSIHPQPTNNDSSTIKFTPLASLRLRWLPPAIVGSSTRPPPLLAQREVTRHHVLVSRLGFSDQGLGATQPWAKSRANNRPGIETRMRFSGKHDR